jgi:hypothetical protein
MEIKTKAVKWETPEILTSIDAFINALAEIKTEKPNNFADKIK